MRDRLKRILFAAAIFSLSFSLLSIGPISAATKAGTVCKTLNQKVTSGGLVYTCIKSGSKKVWSKGVKVVVKPAPKPAPTSKPSITPTPAPTATPMPSATPSSSPSPSLSETATPTPTATATPTPTATVQPSTFFAFRFNSKDQLERKGNQESSWKVADAKDVAGISEIRLKAFAAIKGNTPDTTLPSKTVYSIGENVPKDMLSAYKKIVDQSYAYWGKFMFGKDVPILIFTEKDRALLKSFWMLRWNGESTIARYERELKYYDDTATQLSRSVGGAAGGQELKIGDSQGVNPLVGIDFYMGSLHSQETSLLIDHIAHEFTHVFQNTLAAGVSYSKVVGDWTKPESLVETDIRVPCSLFEGSAVTFGTSIPADSARWYSDGMDVIMRRFQNSNQSIYLATPEDVMNSLVKARSWLPNSCDMGYPLGALAYEYMVAEYGFDSYVKLFQAIPKTTNFDDSMKAAIGLTELEFYQKAAPHILKEWKRANGQS
jgi:hypothetical protein